MAQRNDDEKLNIINEVVAEIKKKVHTKQLTNIEAFVRQFYMTTAQEDLIERDLMDLSGSMIAMWQLIEKRMPDETKIRVYNPHFEEDGWQSTHTIIELILKDRPFLVDSLVMELNRLGLSIHYIIHLGSLRVRRNVDGMIEEVLPLDSTAVKDVIDEAPIYIEIDRQTDQATLKHIKERFAAVLSDVIIAVDDWQLMRNCVNQALDNLNQPSISYPVEEISETKAFLQWIIDDHFTLLGCRYYALHEQKGRLHLQADAESSLGILRDNRAQLPMAISADSPEVRVLLESKTLVIIAKTTIQSTVHRPTYMDWMVIKQFDDQGKLKGALWIIGHNTASAYNTTLEQVPLLRRKAGEVLRHSGFNLKSHAGKSLQNILENIPRDDLFQANEQELLDLALGILHIEERRKIRFFARPDVYGNFISCLLYIPREDFSTDLREAMQAVLQQRFASQETNFSILFSESVLARIHFIFRIDAKNKMEIDIKDIERELTEIGQSWVEQLRDALVEYYGEEEGNRLTATYDHAFPASYREIYNSRNATYDIYHIEKVLKGKKLEMNFYRPLDDLSGNLRFKVFHADSSLPLSDVLPILENMGLRVLSERSHEIKIKQNATVWINDFGMYYDHGTDVDVAIVKEIFQDAFENIWLCNAENDEFNKLILKIGLTWREINILRAYAKYLRQIGFSFTQSYIAESLINNSGLARDLIALFELRFDPTFALSSQMQAGELIKKIYRDLDQVANLDEDRTIRRYVDLILATVRSNYYQLDEQGQVKNYISFKFDCHKIPELPLPYPMYEIFMYSPRVEGVHLRAGKVARGGIRWSDRFQDFRTEILGLVKAQSVKNAQIVPTGAKGGFVTKLIPANADRETIMKEGIECYKIFISSLLDITDNLDSGKIISPTNVIRYDEDDPYLVVAADKGTASFSDIANAISVERNFWLGDAFASGGSTGYDHKAIGITARGAWESVKRHFRELNMDIMKDSFTVVGIGDMAGDVFGNGMLLSNKIKLVAAFNHQHIFLDPNPNPEISFKERQRMFNLPRSSWEDYDRKLISKGGGIYKRSEKSIQLSPEIKAILDIKQDALTPNALISAILQAPVDLLWNGGIGTYVKATEESNVDVGDRSNDALRINASQLRCKVVGEGGNLGFTQRARMEFDLNGGRIYTDFIDNSAGVDCSDHEVNVKILLDAVVANGDLTVKQRNELLAEMTDEISKLVLSDNYHQTQAISLAASMASTNVDLHARYIEHLESAGKLDRSLEFLPDRKTLGERKLMGKGMTRPGISVLLAYTKAILKAEILNSDVPEDPFLSCLLEAEFPQPIIKRFRKEMAQHSLRREIIATQLVNVMVNQMGFTFAYRLNDETGASIPEIVRAFAITRAIFKVDEIWSQLEALDYKIPSKEQLHLMFQVIRVMRRATRWFLRNRRMRLDIAETIKEFMPGVERVSSRLPELFVGKEQEMYQEAINRYIEIGLSADLAKRMAAARGLFGTLDIADASNQYGLNIDEVARVYYSVADKLDLDWVSRQVVERPLENHWEALMREALRDDLDWQQRQLAISVIGHQDQLAKNAEEKFQSWVNYYHMLIERWQHILTELRSATTINFTMLFVASRELLDLTQTCFQAVDMCRLDERGKGNG